MPHFHLKHFAKARALASGSCCKSLEERWVWRAVLKKRPGSPLRPGLSPCHLHPHKACVREGCGRGMGDRAEARPKKSSSFCSTPVGQTQDCSYTALMRCDQMNGKVISNPASPSQLCWLLRSQSMNKTVYVCEIQADQNIAGGRIQPRVR